MGSGLGSAFHSAFICFLYTLYIILCGYYCVIPLFFCPFKKIVTKLNVISRGDQGRSGLEPGILVALMAKAVYLIKIRNN